MTRWFPGLRLRAAALLGAIVLVAGCGPGEPTADGPIRRWHDPEYEVVCWLYWGDGLSCLPEGDVRERQP